MTAAEKKELAQLKADIRTLARMLVDHQGAKPSLLAILARYEPGTVETRPHQAPELREAV